MAYRPTIVSCHARCQGDVDARRQARDAGLPLAPRGILVGGDVFKQFYLGCLAQASYLIGSDGEAAVVDPRRDVDEYLAEAERRACASVT